MVLIELESNIDPDTAERALMAAEAALEKKAENLKVLDLSHLSGFTDCFLICSAQNDRQVRAISDAIASRLRAEGIKPLSIEGSEEGRWVLMDFGDFVVHIFLDAIREYYEIEKLWHGAQVIKLPAEFYQSSMNRLN